MANFTNGGSFRVGYLPPNFQESDLGRVDLTTLSAYPSVDMDPKDTSWKHFRSVDERNVAFHWMKPLTDDNVESFGGWITFYVVGSLVQTLNTSGSVQLVVESAGGFEFMQPAPLNDNGPNPNADPIGWARHVLSGPGCDDMAGDIHESFIQICNNTTRNLPTGFMNAVAPGGDFPESYGGHISDAEKFIRHDIENGKSVISDNAHLVAPGAEDYLVGITRNGYKTDLPPLNADYSGSTSMKAVTTTATGTTEFTPMPQYRAYTMKQPVEKVAAIPYVSFELRSIRVKEGWEFATAQYAEKATVLPINVAGCGITSQVATTLPNLEPTESIVLFCNSRLNSINIQTQAIASAIKAWRKGSRPQTCYVYALRSDDVPGPLLLLRLQPNGMFSCAAANADTIIYKPQSRLYLEFMQELPLGTPLPPTAGTSSFLRKAGRATKAILNGIEPKLASQTELWNALQY